jgi:hypothetical protein
MATKRRHWILTAGILVSTSGCGLTLGEHGLDSPSASESKQVAAKNPKYVEGTVEFCLPPDMLSELDPKSSQGVSSYRPVARVGSPASIMLVQATEPAPQPAALPAKKAPEPVQKTPIFRSASAQEIYVAGSLPPPRTDAASPSPTTQSSCATPSTAWGRWRQKLRDCIAPYYADFSYTKLGQFLYEQGRTMVANGDASRMVLYDYDFVEGGEALNTRGKDQLAKIQAMLPQNFFPLVIERTPNEPNLAKSRRQQVLKELAKGSFPIPQERVVIAASPAGGLTGVEADLINKNLILQTQKAGIGRSGEPYGTTPVTTSQASPFSAGGGGGGGGQ